MTLHYAEVNFEGNIEEYIFNNFDNHSGKQLFWEKLTELVNNRTDIVWLVSVDDEVFVTDKYEALYDFVESINIMRSDRDMYSNIFLQEYNSFEVAYEVALNMQEIKKKCYEP